MRLVSFATDRAPDGILDEIRALCERAFDGEFTAEDWAHACGGIHVVSCRGGVPVAHGALVERLLRVGGREVRVGYVEAVATDPLHQGRGHGTAVMRELGARVTAAFPLGVLSTGEHGFYTRLGWERWRGPSFVRFPDRIERSVDDDDGIMFLRTAERADVDPWAPIECDARPGDPW